MTTQHLEGFSDEDLILHFFKLPGYHPNVELSLDERSINGSDLEVVAVYLTTENSIIESSLSDYIYGRNLSTEDEERKKRRDARFASFAINELPEEEKRPEEEPLPDENGHMSLTGER